MSGVGGVNDRVVIPPLSAVLCESRQERASADHRISFCARHGNQKKFFKNRWRGGQVCDIIRRGTTSFRRFCYDTCRKKATRLRRRIVAHRPRQSGHVRELAGDFGRPRLGTMRLRSVHYRDERNGDRGSVDSAPLGDRDRGLRATVPSLRCIAPTLREVLQRVRQPGLSLYLRHPKPTVAAGFPARCGVYPTRAASLGHRGSGSGSGCWPG